eukprot:TRINITY_DN384_c0_g1_i5.p1 TRINITY_DN384_c0_g1~~TRINITY_DN384_c0_g1_i5.p1  ORF type:complete len:367 (+),score=46.25 TRINITY_DN384_c0_g1_i5:817-1917(+)
MPVTLPTLVNTAIPFHAASQQLSTVVRLECEGGCLTAWKVGFSAILLAEGLLFAHIVFFVRKFTDGPKLSLALRIGNAFSAGIFLAAGLLHIFPEAVELLAGEGHGGHGGHARMLGTVVRVLSNLVSEEDELHDDHHGEGEEHEEEGHEGEFPWAYLITGIAFYLLFFVEQILFPKLFPTLGSHSHSVETKDVEEDVEKSDNAQQEGRKGGFTSRAFIQGLLDVVGISLHSLFESMALGVSDSFDVMLNIFIAVVTHRWATATALSFKLIRDLRYLPFLVLMTLFSSAVPIGVAIGAGLSSLSATVQGVLFSVSAGTFLYIGAFELMAEEYVEHGEWKVRKFLFTILGAGIITVITVILSATGVHG